MIELLHLWEDNVPAEHLPQASITQVIRRQAYHNRLYTDAIRNQLLALWIDRCINRKGCVSPIVGLGDHMEFHFLRQSISHIVGIIMRIVG